MPYLIYPHFALWVSGNPDIVRNSGLLRDALLPAKIMDRPDEKNPRPNLKGQPSESWWDKIGPVHLLMALILLAFLFKDTAIGEWAFSVLPESWKSRF